MPVIQRQDFPYVDKRGNPAVHSVLTVAGLPERWGKRAASELMRALKKHGPRSEQYQRLANLLDSVTSGPIPVDATDAHLCVLAERYAADCAGVPVVEALEWWPMGNVPGDGVGPRQYGRSAPGMTERARMASICELRGITAPDGDDDEQAIRRMVDATWWRRSLRRVHGRLVEHAAMRLGFVSIRAGSYCSDETANRRMQQNARNAAALKATMLKNDQGQEFSLYDLAQKGMANKANRKGELMLRMAGCEAVAKEYGHVGLFVTGTCPGKFHAVLHKTGTANPKYAEAGSPTPRQAQDWLNTAWQRTRAQNGRDGIAPYGFRIAEPHHDGTPHWHMLVFLPRDQVNGIEGIGPTEDGGPLWLKRGFIQNMSEHWLAEDYHEVKHDESIRVKFVEIDPKRGTAAGYIAKYVGKNIDDSQGAAFDEEGIVASALPACARVDAWASVWGIRQFQGLGMPPVTVWREARRVKDDYDQAPEYVQRVLTASRRLEGQGPTLDGKPVVLKAADFAEYIRAQGGVNLGRDYLVRLAVDHIDEAPGRYGVIEIDLPKGVYGITAPEHVCLSLRFTWTRAGSTATRSPLNNCTDRAQPGHEDAAKPWPKKPTGAESWHVDQVFDLAPLPDELDDWWDSEEYRGYVVEVAEAVEHFGHWHDAAAAAKAATVWTETSYTEAEIKRVAMRARAIRAKAERARA